MKSRKISRFIIYIGLILFFLTACLGSAQVSFTPTPIPPTSTPFPPTFTPFFLTVIPTEVPPTETLIPPMETLELPTSTEPFTLQFEISDADRQTDLLIPICERVFVTSEDQVIIPYLLDCYHELYSSNLNGNNMGVVSGGADMGMLANGLLAAVFANMRFVSYSLNGKTIQEDTGKYWGTGELWVSSDAQDKYIVIVKLPALGDWSGYVQSADPAFDLKKPIDQQPQSPLQKGDQFE